MPDCAAIYYVGNNGSAAALSLDHPLPLTLGLSQSAQSRLQTDRLLLLQESFLSIRGEDWQQHNKTLILRSLAA